MRLTLALVAAAAVGAAEAVILGEYPFEGATVLVAGVVFGLFIGEAARAVARAPSVPLGIGCALIGLLTMTWAAWISTGRDLSFLGPAGWTAIAIAAASAGLRTGWVRGERSRPGAGSPPPPSPEPSTEDRPA